MDKSIGDMNTMGGGRDKPGGYTLAIGDTLGQYRIIRPLGRGGMGEVYEAENAVSRKRIALKVLPRAATGGAFVDRFRIESRVMSDLRHPHIVEVLHAGEQDGLYYLTMDLVLGPDGEPHSLEDRLWRSREGSGETGGKLRTAFAEADVRTLALQICDALAYAHGKGVVHRDLKPANILMADDGSLRVTDFGLAKVVGGDYLQSMIDRSISLSMAGGAGDASLGDGPTKGGGTATKRPSSSARALLGTYDYMSPEQKAGGEITPRTDLYAFGVILYRLLTGEKPEGRWRPPSACGLSKKWDVIIEKCMERNPADRWQTAEELKGALAGLGGGTGRQPRGGAETRRKGIGYWVLGIGCLAILATASVVSIRSIRSQNAARVAERAAADAAATRDAAQQARVAALKVAVETALAADDLETAGAKIAELEQAGGAAAAAELRKKYEAKAGERETNKRYAAASLAREKAQKLDRGQGFGARLDAMEMTWREAEAARQGGGWGQALSGYDAVLAACRTVDELGVARQDAEARRKEADEARRAAAGENAAADAAALFETGGRSATRAAEAFETGDFMAAGKAWQEAAAAFASAKSRALAVQDYRKAKADFEAALAADEPGTGGRASPRAALLAKHGGPKWADVQRQQRIGSASANDPAEGARAFAAALVALPGAVTEARSAEKAEAERLAAEKAAEAERQARQEREARERERQGALTAALAAARQAQAAGDWQTCATRAGEALTLEAGNAEAAALKRTAEGNLKPKEPNPGEETTVDLGNGVKLALCWCPADIYTRGSPASESGRYDDETQHRVTLSKGFWMGKHEVTQAQWEAVMGNNPSNFKNAGKNAPVEQVSWDDCQEFVRKVNARVPGGGFRLPTEAEWEYACRAGTTTAFHYGNDLDATIANFDGNYPYGNGRKGEYRQTTVPVGTFRANAWNLYDMHGNVWEWCSDWYGAYPSGSVTDPAGPGSGSLRVSRGGGWCSLARRCRSAGRGWCDPGLRDGGLGLRLARTLSP